MTTFHPMELDEFQSKILSGDINIQQPIQLVSPQGNEIKLVSFTDYFYLYPNMNKEKYLPLLIGIFQSTYTKMKEIIYDSELKQVYGRLLSIMGKSDAKITDIENIFSDENEVHKMYEHFISTYQSINSNLNQPVVSPLSIMVGGSSFMGRQMDSFNIIYQNTKDQFEQYHKKLQNSIKQLAEIPIDVFIHFSMINNFNYEERQNIPEKIHQIFLNYVCLFSILKVELYRKKQNLSNLIQEIEQKNNEITDMKHNMEAISKSGIEKAYQENSS
jgi:hypothetical protein